jgi:hypothetical protein
MPTSHENNQHIYQLMKDHNVTTAWIGVHKADPEFHTELGVEIS